MIAILEAIGKIIYPLLTVCQTLLFAMGIKEENLYMLISGVLLIPIQCIVFYRLTNQKVIVFYSADEDEDYEDEEDDE